MSASSPRRVRPSSRRRPRFPLRRARPKTSTSISIGPPLKSSNPSSRGPGPEPQLVVVPDLVGLTKGEAAGKLRDVGLSLGAVSFQPAPQARSDAFSSETYCRFECGSRSSIDIFSAVIKPLTVPDFIGSSFSSKPVTSLRKPNWRLAKSTLQEHPGSSSRKSQNGQPGRPRHGGQSASSPCRAASSSNLRA